jgi:hypothetical protein
VSAVDIERYRKRVEAELEKAAPANQRARREARTQPAGEPTSPDVREAALTTAPLPEEDLTDRVAALLSLLLDRKASVAERAAALQALGALDFLGPRFEPHRADYKQALRQLATDPRATLREKALELLAIGKDPYAQDLLVKSLENPEEAVVSEAKAMQLLAYDDHAELTPLAQKVYKRSTGAAREEALRMLATDPSSERLLTRLLKDKSETSSIRRISASGLQSLNPAAFEKTARTIVTDDDDYDEIRATSLAALAHGREAHEKPADPKFVEAVQNVSETTKSTALRSSSKRYLRDSEA